MLKLFLKIGQLQTLSPEVFQRCFDQYKITGISLLIINGSNLKKINISLIYILMNTAQVLLYFEYVVGVPNDVMTKVLNCSVEGNKFELKSYYYIHF